MRGLLHLTPILCLVSAMAVGVTGCGRNAVDSGRSSAAQPPQPVEVTPVTRRDLVETLALVGSLVPNESAQIRAEIAGPVRAIRFQEGERVEQGRVLVKIDDADLLAQLAEAEARFKLSELNLQRARSLRQTQINTQADYDRAQSEYSSVEAEIARLRVRLEKTEIKAPFVGVVGARSVSPGDYVDSTMIITKISDLSRMKVDFEVPERFLGKIRVGTIFTVTSREQMSDSRVQGEVYFIDPVIDLDSRTAEVKGYLTNPPPTLQAGMFANIELVLDEHRAVLTVPEGAILVLPEGPRLILVQDRNREKVAAFLPVQLGLRARGLVEVASLTGDLKEGQPVVASGVGGLTIYAGTQLDPRPLRKEFQVGN